MTRSQSRVRFPRFTSGCRRSLVLGRDVPVYLISQLEEHRPAYTARHYGDGALADPKQGIAVTDPWTNRKNNATTQVFGMETKTAGRPYRMTSKPSVALVSRRAEALCWRGLLIVFRRVTGWAGGSP